MVGGLYVVAFLLARRFRFLADKQLVDDRTTSRRDAGDAIRRLEAGAS